MPRRTPLRTALTVATFAAWVLRRRKSAGRLVVPIPGTNDGDVYDSRTDRRSGRDRRSGAERRQASNDLSSALTARIHAAANRRSGHDRRSGEDRRAPAAERARIAVDQP